MISLHRIQATHLHLKTSMASTGEIRRIFVTAQGAGLVDFALIPHLPMAPFIVLNLVVSRSLQGAGLFLVVGYQGVLLAALFRHPCPILHF